MSTKAKAAGVNVSSFWDLKAELAKQESSLAATKAAGGQVVVKGGIHRPEKKGRKWERLNKGVVQRAAKDSTEWAKIERPTYEIAQAALARKAKIYNKLRKGQTGGLNENQYDALLVDFDEKQLAHHYESDSDDVDESLTIPTAPDENDPIVEYQDEFGRVRTAKRSEVPREYMNTLGTSAQEDDDPYVIRGPIKHFPVYEPDAEQLEAIRKAAEEVNAPLASHYDANQEVRAKGAAFYQFSADEEERQRQLNELKQSREETMRKREETGAVDAPVGLEPDMGAGTSESQAPTQSRAQEKRKRDLEARRQAIEAKRRKKEEAAAATGITETPDPVPAIPTEQSEADIRPKETLPTHPISSSSTRKSKPVSAADNFLANLERDMMGSR